MARKTCNVCNVRKGTDANGSSFNDMCDPCYQEGGWENTHNDGDHENIIAGNVVYGMTTHKTEAEFKTWLKEEREGCWICFPELNLAKKPAKAVGTPKQPVVRRPQLNHKGHSHPATSKARATCRAVFWSSLTAVANISTLEQIAVAMQTWDMVCDAQGIIPAKKAATWKVIPNGPKGGVINQLKKSPIK